MVGLSDMLHLQKLVDSLTIETLFEGRDKILLRGAAATSRSRPSTRSGAHHGGHENPFAESLASCGDVIQWDFIAKVYGAAYWGDPLFTLSLVSDLQPLLHLTFKLGHHTL